MLNFFLGWHQPNSGPSGPGSFDKTLISINRLLNRRSSFSVKDWILDCGAFTRISGRGGHLSVRRYAKQVHRWQRVGHFLGAVAQDYPISTKILEATQLTAADHQRLSVHRYDRLVEELYSINTSVLAGIYLADLEYGDYWEDSDYDLANEVEGEIYDTIAEFIEDEVEGGAVNIPYIIPVAHGSTPKDYLEHIELYGDRIRPGAWVGVGSLVGRSAREIEDILLALKTRFPTLSLHGFGVKKSVLNKSAIVRSLLFSADSLAGSIRARRANRNPNDPAGAAQYLSELNLDQCVLVN